MADINGITLDPDQTVWTDEWEWTPVGQSVEIDIHGGIVDEYISPNRDGRPVTLYIGWVDKTTLDQVLALAWAETQQIVTLNLPDGRALDVLFDHQGGNPVQVSPVVERTEYQAADLFEVTLVLLEVQS